MLKKTTKEPPSRIQIYFSHPWDVIKTVFLLLTWIVMSIHIELVAPTMSILAANVNVHYSGMGSVLASRGAGYLVANILGAILQNIVKKHSDGILACAFILPAIAVFASPFVTSIIVLGILFFIQGIGHGLTDLGGNNVILTMWGNNAAAPLNIVQVGYGIGAVVVNLLVRPFLTEKVSSIDDTDNEGIDSTLVSNTVKEDKATIFIPYTITAVLCVLIAVGHIFFYIRTLKTQKEKLKVQEAEYAVVSTNSENVDSSVENKEASQYSPLICGRGNFQYGLILSILFVSSVFFILGNDTTFSKFFFTYLKFDQFNISTGAASWAVILFWLSYSIGRLITAVVSVYVSVVTCLNIVWICGLCLAVAWLVFVWVIGLSAISLFILGGITGLVFAPIIPLTFAFYNQRLKVIPFLLAIVLCGSALGIMIFPKIGGLVMDRNPNHFPTLLFICMSMSILLYVISNVVHYFHQRKNAPKAKAPIPDGLNEEEEMTYYLRDQEQE